MKPLCLANSSLMEIHLERFLFKRYSWRFDILPLLFILSPSWIWFVVTGFQTLVACDLTLASWSQLQGFCNSKIWFSAFHPHNPEAPEIPRYLIEYEIKRTGPYIVLQQSLSSCFVLFFWRSMPPLEKVREIYNFIQENTHNAVVCYSSIEINKYWWQQRI